MCSGSVWVCLYAFMCVYNTSVYFIRGCVFSSYIRYSTSQKKLNGSNGTCNFGDGNVTLLQSSTSVTRELLDCNLKVT